MFKENNKHLIAILAEHGYEYIKEIGRGSYGVCSLVTSVKYKTQFVCKSFHFSKDEDNYDKLANSFKHETEALCSLTHPNVVHIYDYFQQSHYLCLIIEYCPGGSLLPPSNKKINSDLLLKYIPQLVSALVYIHAQHIAHLDIKPANILIDAWKRPKLADFGLASFCDPNGKLTNFRGSFIYTAPELFSRAPYDPFKADIWSFGVTLYVLATGQLPFAAKDPAMLLKLIKIGYTAPSPKLPHMVTGLIEKCLQENPEHRPTAEELLIFIREEQEKIKIASNSLLGVPQSESEPRLKLANSRIMNLSSLNHAGHLIVRPSKSGMYKPFRASTSMNLPMLFPQPPKEQQQFVEATAH